MMVVCAKCGCTIVMYAGEGPLCSCPMCGHRYNECTVGTSTSMPQDEMVREIAESFLRDSENAKVFQKRNREDKRMNAIVIRKTDEIPEDEWLLHVIYKNGPHVYWEESLSKEDVHALRAVCDFLLREVYE